MRTRRTFPAVFSPKVPFSCISVGLQETLVDTLTTIPTQVFLLSRLLSGESYLRTILGLRLHFLEARGLTSATVYLDEFLPLRNHTDPMGAIIEYSCRGPRPVRLQARTVRYKASGMGLGDPMERVLEVLGEPEYVIGEDPSIPKRATFSYFRKGISFYGQAGIIVAIRIQLFTPRPPRP